VATRAQKPLWGQIALLTVIMLICVFPFYWMVTTSLKTQVVALEAPPVWIFEPTLANYREALFEDRHRGVRDPRVQVAGRLEVEERRGLVDAVEHVRRGLVNRDGP